MKAESVIGLISNSLKLIVLNRGQGKKEKRNLCYEGHPLQNLS